MTISVHTYTHSKKRTHRSPQIDRSWQKSKDYTQQCASRAIYLKAIPQLLGFNGIYLSYPAPWRTEKSFCRFRSQVPGRCMGEVQELWLKLTQAEGLHEDWLACNSQHLRMEMVNLPRETEQGCPEWAGRTTCHPLLLLVQWVAIKACPI